MEMINSTRDRPAVPIPLSFFIINSFSVKVLQISEDYVNPQKTYITNIIYQNKEINAILKKYTF